MHSVDHKKEILRGRRHGDSEDEIGGDKYAVDFKSYNIKQF